MNLRKFLSGQEALVIEFGKEARLVIYRPGAPEEFQVLWANWSKPIAGLPDFGDKISWSNLQSLFQTHTSWMEHVTLVETGELTE